MKIAPKIKAFIEKLQGLPEDKKKIILWAIIVVLGLIFLSFWINASVEKFKTINQSAALEPFNSLIEQTKLSDESLDKINEIKDNISDIKNSEIIKQLEKEAKNNPPAGGQNSNAIK